MPLIIVIIRRVSALIIHRVVRNMPATESSILYLDSIANVRRSRRLVYTLLDTLYDIVVRPPIVAIDELVRILTLILAFSKDYLLIDAILVVDVDDEIVLILKSSKLVIIITSNLI